LVAAHRGLSSRAPENTLVSLEMGIGAGADLLECDVRLSADGVAVLHHDVDLRRTTGHPGEVRSLTLGELKQLDPGRWKGVRFAGQTIPTLQEALQFIAGRRRLIVEIKEPDMAASVLSAIRAAAVDPAEVLLFSFHREVLEAIVADEPLIPATWLARNLPPGIEAWQCHLAMATEAGMSAVGLSVATATIPRIDLAHQCALPVFVWTANEEADMRELIEAGVDGMCTDYPGRLLKLLGRSTTAPVAGTTA